ncbi:hypothetical protein GQ457_06G002710 [Hibiscus cannabinus]
MVVQKLEFCMELVELAVKFVIVVAEAVEKAVNDINHRRPSIAMMATRSFPAPVPLVLEFKGVNVRELEFEV